MSGRLGLVAIGRNEGERLVRCLRSIAGAAECFVYVDSGSTDTSVESARALGADVVALDMSRPFTAARARNAGFAHLASLAQSIEYVQFVDGDCELAPGWLAKAAAALDNDSSVGMVCGRLRERNREATLYNRLCDLEWNRPSGRVDTCGGIVMIRRSTLEKVGGYNETMIAGEDPELCVRFRAAGAAVLRLPDDMAYHDAAMTRFGQWWKRMRRSGWAYAAGAALHGSLRGGHNVRSVARALAWGFVLPVAGAALLAASAWNPWLLLGLAAIFGLYLLVTYRTFLARRRLGDGAADAMIYSLFCVLGKPAECLGVLGYWLGRARSAPAQLIEYK